MTATLLAPTLSPHRPPPPAKWEGFSLDVREAFAGAFDVHVGIDIGKEFHWWVATRPGGSRTRAVKLYVGRAEFTALDDQLTALYPDVPRHGMLVGVEPAGNYGDTLEAFLKEKGYRVVRVLPSVTKRFKEAEDNSPRKDDKKDAAQVCKLVGQGYFVESITHDEYHVTLRILASEYHRLTKEHTALKNGLISALDTGFTELLPSFSDIDKKTVQAILQRWPLAQDFAAVPLEEVYSLVKKVSRNQVKEAEIRALHETARTSVALRTAPKARRAQIARYLERRAIVVAQRDAVEARLGELVAQHPGATALLTIPEVNVGCAGILLAEIGDPTTFKVGEQVIKLAGMNLARSTSGISVRGRVRQTKRGRPMLRRQFFLLAGRWCLKRGMYRALYEKMLARGMPKPKAVCAIARKLAPLILAILKSGEAFDADRWYRTHPGIERPAPKATAAKPRKRKATAQKAAAIAKLTAGT